MTGLFFIQIYCTITYLKVGNLLLTQTHDVVSEVLHVVFAKCLRHAGHVSRIVGSVTRLEISQLLHYVVVLLTGNAGDFVLSPKFSKVAHRTQSFVSFSFAEFDFSLIRDEGIRFNR